MSTEELLRAIDYCYDTGTSLTTHGQSDDYMVASLQVVKYYKDELTRRENSREHKGEKV